MDKREIIGSLKIVEIIAEKIIPILGWLAEKETWPEAHWRSMEGPKKNLATLEFSTIGYKIYMVDIWIVFHVELNGFWTLSEHKNYVLQSLVA